MDIDEPIEPVAQDSPHHILNALNDYVIQEILRRLDNVEDFLNAAEVCTRFQKNAKNCFPSKFEKISIGREVTDFQCVEGEAVPMERVYSFLSIFGRQIKGIVWFASGHSEIDNETLEMIGHFCGKTLLSLHINGFWSKYPKRLRFKSLLNLTLDNSWAKKLKFPTQLKYLGIWGHNPQGRLPLQIRRFSNLEELDLRLLDTLSYERLIQFSSLNPQVNKLTVWFCRRIRLSLFEAVTTHTPGIEQFCFGFGKFTANYRYRALGKFLPYDHWKHLGRMKNLKKLTLSGGCIRLGNLIKLLVESDIRIEHLGLHPKKPFNHLLENIPEVKTLKTLEISDFTAASLLKLVDAQPSLEEITIDDTFGIERDTVKKAFLKSGNLSQLSTVQGNSHGLIVEVYTPNPKCICGLFTQQVFLVPTVFDVMEGKLNIGFAGYGDFILRRYLQRKKLSPFRKNILCK